MRLKRRMMYGSGVWYMRPSSWGSRFNRVLDEIESDGKEASTVEATIAYTIPASKRYATFRRK